MSADSGGESGSTSGSSALVLADAHVHFHACFDLEAFLDAALDNFTDAVGPGERDQRIIGFLLLVDPGGADTFDHWLQACSGTDKAWDAHPTEEPCSVLMSRRGSDEAFVAVAGRQIRSEERLEVLAYGSHEGIPDGLPFPEALRRARAAAPLVSVPWGFGKWWLERGRIIRSLIDHDLGGNLYLSDNACRPGWMKGPERLQRQRGTRRPVLRGTDPLPFPDHEKRAGSFGFTCRTRLDTSRPFGSLVDHLAGGGSIGGYGRRRGAAGIVIDQIRIRLGHDADRAVSETFEAGSSS